MMVSEDVNLQIFFLPLVNTLFIYWQNEAAIYKPGFGDLKHKGVKKQKWEVTKLHLLALL